MFWEELDIHISSEVFWTNSQTVLGYVSNDSWRFNIFVASRAQFIHLKIFIANRVQFIRGNTDIAQWHYISTNDHPVDDTSRRQDSKNLGEWKDGSIVLNSFGHARKHD